ncbi:MAG: hypothetical protein IPM41_12395 [Sphingomonadales bacterium]|nr:hypothetical protein [Sphingomonadales bacterium]
METERTLVGYKTELNIRFLEAAEDEASSLDAATVVEVLGPVYYDSSATTEKTEKST